MPAELSYELDHGDGVTYTFGQETDVLVLDLEVGQADIVSNDASLPMQDGLRFGRDYRAGRVITFEMIVLLGTGADALDALARLETAWLADTVRGTPGAVSILKLTRGGRTRRVYGRPRRFALASERDRFGWLSVTADFQCVDHLFYGDAELVTNIGMSAPSVGGLVGPLIGPIDAEAATEGLLDVNVGGTVPAWSVIRINGPIVDPSIELVGSWSFQLNTTLASDQWILVDPTPWNRAVRRNDGANMAGRFTYDSQRLSQLRVPPGRRQFILRGLDPTGSASANVYLREAFSSY